MHWGDIARAGVEKFGPLVIGLDPSPDLAPAVVTARPERFLETFTAAALEAAQGKAAFVKIQSAFFEAHGSDEIRALARSISMARERGFAVILDAKRGDVGSTAEAYAEAYLTPGSGSDLEVDCLTVNPFLGPDTLEPFIDCARTFGKGVLILVKTSNPGSGWLQDRVIEGAPVAANVARLVGKWADQTQGAGGVGAVGAVVGATYPHEAAVLCELMPRSAILAPGLGSQGGQGKALADLGSATRPMLVSASRGITAASDRAMTLDDYVALMAARIDAFRAQLAPVNLVGR